MESSKVTNKYKFYETPTWVSSLIAETLQLNSRAQVLDLGAGKGVLIKALKDKFPNARYDAIEINDDYEEYLRSITKNVHWLDLSVNKVPQQLICKNTQLTVISNPPFGKVEISKEELINLKKRQLIDNRTKTLNSRLELLFIARALEVTKKGSNIAFIVPDTFIDSEKHIKIRETFVKKHGLYKVCKLSDTIFEGAEVSSSILFLKPESGCSEKIIMEDYRKIKKGVSTFLNIATFIDPFNGLSTEGVESLGVYTNLINRGRSCSKALKDRNISHLHSTDLKSLHATKIRLNRTMEQSESGERVATKGDILIARVGTRCLGSTALVISGSSIVSDSIIIIKVSKSKQMDVFQKLISCKGQEWLKKYSTGSCAKILTHNTIQGFPMELA